MPNRALGHETFLTKIHRTFYSFRLCFVHHICPSSYLSLTQQGDQNCSVKISPCETCPDLPHELGGPHPDEVNVRVTMAWCGGFQDPRSQAFIRKKLFSLNPQLTYIYSSINYIQLQAGASQPPPKSSSKILLQKSSEPNALLNFSNFAKVRKYIHHTLCNIPYGGSKAAPHGGTHQDFGRECLVFWWLELVVLDKSCK